MSASEDNFISKDDIVGYLEDREPTEVEDEELEHCYDRIEEYFSRHLETVNDETDLTMAKYWLEQAWLVEDEIDKDGY